MLQYRTPGAEDFDALFALAKEHCEERGYKYKEDLLKKYVLYGMDRTHTIVAEKDGEIIGVTNFYLMEHHFTGEMQAGKISWFVKKEHRGKIGMELLRAAEKAAKEYGAKYYIASTSGKMPKDYEALETEYRKELV